MFRIGLVWRTICLTFNAFSAFITMCDIGNIAFSVYCFLYVFFLFFICDGHVLHVLFVFSPDLGYSAYEFCILLCFFALLCDIRNFVFSLCVPYVFEYVLNLRLIFVFFRSNNFLEWEGNKK